MLILPYKVLHARSDLLQSKFIGLFEVVEIFLNFWGQSKVTDFHFSIFNEDILCLQISVCNTFSMNILYTLY